MRRLLPTLLAAAGLAVAATPAHALQPIEPFGAQLRLTQQGVDGDATTDTIVPDIAYGSKQDEFLAVWESLTTSDTQIFGQRLHADGTPVGAAFQITGVGADAGLKGARDPSVAYDFRRDRYGVAFTRSEGSGREVRLQYVSGGGALLKPDGAPGAGTTKLSSVGPDGDGGRGVLGRPALVFRPDASGDGSPGDRWVVAYSGDQLAEGDFAILASAVDAGDAHPIGEDVVIGDPGATLDAFAPSLAPVPSSDELAVTWQANLAFSDVEVFARRFSSSLTTSGPQRQISQMGDATHNGAAPAIAADPEHGQLAVAFAGEKADGEGLEIRIQRLNLDLGEIGTNDQTVSSAGPAGSGDQFSAGLPAISYLPNLHRFLVTWVGTDNDRPGLASGEREVQGTVLDADGAEGSPQDFVISHMGEDGRLLAAPREPRIAADTATGHWLTIWNADDARAPLADDELEVWGRSVGEDFDQDGDGVPAPADCDDGAAAIHPGAPEVVDNGIDEDCDGADLENPDRDGDGATRPADCDDANPFIHPGALDIAGNGVDEDCSNADALRLTGATIARSFAVFPAFTRVTRLVVKHAQAGMAVTLRCRGRGCGFKTRTVTVRRPGKLRLTQVVRRAKLRPRASIEVRVLEPGAIGRVDRFIARRGALPRQVSRCLPPGASKPGACPR